MIEYPEAVIISGFFLRADLAMLADLATFKNELRNIGGKISTAGRGIDFSGWYAQRDIERLENQRSCVYEDGGVCYTMPVHFYDIAKHVPAGFNLDAVGKLLGLEKLKIPEGFSIARMDELLKKEPKSFVEYALRDAEIAVRYYISVLGFAQREVYTETELASPLIPASAGAMAVKLCRGQMRVAGFDPLQVFGNETQTLVEWDHSTEKVRKKKREVLSADRKFHETMAVDCYHGGRNETFAVGPLPYGDWHDFDLVGAYTTGMLALHQLRFGCSYETREKELFTEDTVGFARVLFKFPADVRYPCLPVRVEDQGLKYPLSGESFCTAPEIALALKLGAEITILRGVIYPMETDSAPIFLDFVQKIRDLRSDYKKAGQSLQEQYAKLLGNSLYGKTGQGLKGKKAFDTASEESHAIPMSQISCAPMAAHVTGFIRAVLSEVINKIPRHRTVVSCTTDGLLTDAPERELDLSGPLSQRFLALCRLVDGDHAVMLKEKHRVKRPLSMKTRACSTLVPGRYRRKDVKRVVLAKGGVSPPTGCEDPNDYMNRLYLQREPGQKVMTRPFVSPREQWVKEIDVFRLEREVRMNLEYDMKRQPINFRMVATPYGQHVAFDTRPWPDIETANTVRAIFDGCRSLPISAKQMLHYGWVLSELKKGTGGSRHLEMIQALRRVSSDPFALNPLEGERASVAEILEHNPKMLWLVDQLRAIRQKGEKAIVFCEFRDLQRMLQRCIGRLGISSNSFALMHSIVLLGTNTSDSGTRTGQVSGKKAPVPVKRNRLSSEDSQEISCPMVAVLSYICAVPLKL